MKFSVIIPLYNKEAEIGRTLHSVLAQTHVPYEIVVVDDGSTDGSAAIVESIVTESGPSDPTIKLIRQKNAGETAARNTAMISATGDYFALVDADDEWRPDFLSEVAALIEEFPACGLYSTGFDIVNNDGAGGTLAEHPARGLQKRGVVENFFRESMSAYVSIPSASVIPRTVFEVVGGFPEGMRLGGDQYMWTKIALRWPVCYSPARLVKYYMSASNRSAAIYKPEVTVYSFEDFYDPTGVGKKDSTSFWIDEYVARVALGKALTISAKGGTAEALRTEKFFAYNRLSRRLWWRLWVLNRTPAAWRPRLHALYTDFAWRFARKGL